MPDIYFEEKYGKLDEFIEEGKSVKYIYEDENGKISNLFMLREIPTKLENETYFDIATPYGYGGPVVEELRGDKSELIKSYMDSFTQYCQKNNIVSEFIRFHPVVKNADDFEPVMNIQFIRNTVCTYFRDNEDVLTSEFHKSARKVIRRALRAGVSYEVIEKPEDLNVFIKNYYDTMDRNQASDNYYFKKEYFEYMLKEFSDNLLNINVYSEDGVCIASGLYFLYGKNMHAHLSGTKHEYLNLSPAYILKYATAEYGVSHGYDYIHYGGGTSNDENNPLLKFKMKFTNSPLCEFKIGKNIYLPEVYNKLVEISQPEKEFFPEYRG